MGGVDSWWGRQKQRHREQETWLQGETRETAEGVVTDYQIQEMRVE